ncbi:MAG: hypothetical protein H6836_01995 [Planctomycetes bacterium]|nr:hypothetical protein [Planctomycetota bacterium]MCB9888319.1 hypothetical protein [Planctomycetota bacterium]
MIPKSNHRSFPVIALLVAASAGAQGETKPVPQDAKATPTTQATDPTALADSLRKGIHKMAHVRAGSFRTTEQQDSAMTRMVARQVGGLGGGNPFGGGDREVRGVWSDGYLKATVGDGGDEILAFRGRMVARNDNVGWKLRRDRTVTGRPLPFVLDPERFFECLAALPAAALRVRDHSTSTYKGKEVQILSVTLEDEDAQEFALSGALPPVSAGFGGGVILGAVGGGAVGAQQLPDLVVDMALYVEPATGYIHKVKTCAYQKSNGMGNVQVQIAGAGLGGDNDNDQEDEDSKVKEKDKDGKRIYKRGMPVRRLRSDTSKLTFDILLSDHERPAPLKLDEKSKKLLRIEQR